MSAVEKFMPLLSDAEEENNAPPPCISHEGVNVCPEWVQPANTKVFIHTPQQSLSTRPYEAKLQCRRNPLVLTQNRAGKICSILKINFRS